MSLFHYCIVFVTRFSIFVLVREGSTEILMDVHKYKHKFLLLYLFTFFLLIELKN